MFPKSLKSMLVGWLRPCIVLMKQEMRHYFRLSGSVGFMFIVPVIPIVLVALLMDNTTKEVYAPIFVPSLCTTFLLSLSFMGGGPYIIQMKQARVYEVFDLLGMTSNQIQFGIMTNRCLLCFAQLSVILLASNLAFSLLSGAEVLFSGIKFVGATLLVSIVFFQISLTLAIFIRNREKARVVARALIYILIPLGGLFFDVTMLPDWMTALAYISPTYNANVLFKSALNGNENIVASIAILVVYCQGATLLNTLLLDFRSKPD